jgi:hypothetical protein
MSKSLAAWTKQARVPDLNWGAQRPPQAAESENLRHITEGITTTRNPAAMHPDRRVLYRLS